MRPLEPTCSVRIKLVSQPADWHNGMISLYFDFLCELGEGGVGFLKANSEL